MTSPKINQKTNSDRRQLKNIALFSDDDEPSLGKSLTHVPIAQIVLPPKQPRRYFDAEKMQSLIESVKKEGILQPILVRPLDGKYELVAGERRYRAALEAQLAEIPIISKILSDEEASQYALIENLQREDLNAIEETEGILELLAIKLNLPTEEVISRLNQIANTKRGITDNVVRSEEIQIIEEVFKQLGRLSAESFRTHRLSLLKLPSELLNAIRQGKIEYTKVKEIAKVRDETLRIQLLEDAIENNLSLSEIKKQVAALRSSSDITSPKSQIQIISHRLNQAKLWEKDKKAWKKVEGLLEKIEKVLSETQATTGLQKEKIAEIDRTILETNLNEVS